MESSWRSKVNRAREHLNSLEEAERTFLAQKPYRTATTREGNDVVVRVHDLASIPPGLSLIVGDAVHNARTALDHVVMQLAMQGRGTLERAPSTDREERRLSFPVTDDDAGFKRWARDVEPYLSDSAIAVIEALQGFRLLEQLEKDHGHLEEDERASYLLLDPLARLHRLDNHDKHRRLALSLWFPGTVDHGAAAAPDSDDADVVTGPVTDPAILAMLEELDRRESEDPTTVDFFFAGGPVTEGAELGRFMRADGGWVVDDPEVSATLRIVLVEADVTGRFLGAPPVQSVITSFVDAAEEACALVESRGR